MENITIYELINNEWEEMPELDFGFVTIGNFVSKTLCFSPRNGNIADLKVRIEDNNNTIFSSRPAAVFSIMGPGSPENIPILPLDFRDSSPLAIKAGINPRFIENRGLVVNPQPELAINYRKMEFVRK